MIQANKFKKSRTFSDNFKTELKAANDSLLRKKATEEQAESDYKGSQAELVNKLNAARKATATAISDSLAEKKAQQQEILRAGLPSLGTAIVDGTAKIQSGLGDYKMEPIKIDPVVDTKSDLLKTLSEKKSSLLSEVTSRDTAARLRPQISEVDKNINLLNQNNEDNFVGQSKASYGQGRLSQDAGLAWGEYLENPTAENRKKAELATAVLKQYQTQNKDALADDATLPWLSQSAAGYLPQFIDQTEARVTGGAIGAASVGIATGGAGAWKGWNIGSAAASAAQMFKLTRGTAFQNLLELGVDEKTAMAAVNDEAILSSLVEFADTLLDNKLFGIKSLGAVALGKLVPGAVKQGAEAAAKSAAGKVLTGLAKYGINIAGEALEEGTQEALSIANEQRIQNGGNEGIFGLAKGTAGVVRDDVIGGANGANRQRVLEAASEGAKIAAMFGGAQMVGNYAMTKAMGSGSNANQNAAVPSVDSPAPVNYDKSTQQTIEKAQTADLGEPVVTKTATVLDRGTTAYLDLAMANAGQKSPAKKSIKRAEAKAKVVQKLINGEQVSLDGMKSLNLTDAKYRAVFTQLTGVVFPEGMTNHDQLMNVAKTANEVRNNVAAEPVAVEAPVVPMVETQDVIAQDIAQTEAPVSGEEAMFPSYEEFASIQKDRYPELTDEKLRGQYEQFSAREQDTVNNAFGQPVTRAQWRKEAMRTNPGATAEMADAYFDEMRAAEQQAAEKAVPVEDAGVGTTKTGGKGLYRDAKNEYQKVDKKTQKLLDEIGKRLGITVVLDSGLKIQSGDKKGEAARGHYSHETRTLRINPELGVSAVRTFRHELTHYIQDSKPEVYEKLVNVVKNHKQYDSIRAEVEGRYEGIESDESRIMDEVMAEYAEQMCTDEQFIELLAKTDRNLFEILRDAITEFFDKLKGIDPGLDAEVEQIKKLWADALKAAEKSNTEGRTDKGHYSFSSIASTFFGNENMTAADFESGDYKKTDGYKAYVKQCLDNMSQSRLDYDEKAARKEIKDSIDGIVRVALAMKKAGYDILDSKATRNVRDSKKRLLFSSLEPNSDYLTSSDISTICDKRKNFAAIYDDIVKAEEAKNVPKGKRFFDNVDNYFYLHKMMADKGLTQPCRQCYVESMRKNLAPMASAFLRLVNETDANNTANDQLYNQKGKNKGTLKTNNAKLRENVLNILSEYGMSTSDLTVETLTTADGLATLKIQSPLVYEAFNSFYGQSKPKMPKAAVPFRFGELTALLTDDHGNIKTSLIDKIESTGGFRLQSYSDFQIQNFVDVLQVIFEAGTLGLTGHAYTKVPAFLMATEGTGLKRNVSIFMYKDGDYWRIDKNDSFPGEIEDIYAIVESDVTGNTSIIAVSQNEDMSAWIMANGKVGYGIPFHKSGLKMGVVRDTVVREDGREIKGYTGTKDHTRQQTEVWAKTSEDHKALTKVSKGINIYEFWDFENADGLSKNELIEKNVKAYIDACTDRGYLPKFREYVMNNRRVLEMTLSYAKELGFVSEDAGISDIAFEYKGYIIPYGYYKFLGDFGMFTPAGEAAPHAVLSLKNYDFDKAVQFFSDAETLRRNEILQQFANDGERQKYRDSGMTAEQLAEVAQQKRNEIVDEVVGRNAVGDNDEVYLDGVENQTESEYNAVKELQRNFDGTVATAPGVKLSNQTKTSIASAVLTGDVQMDESGKMGRVNVGSSCYLFEPFDDGGVYVYDTKTHQELNNITMLYRTGGNYGRNRRNGQNPAGARGSVPVRAEHHVDSEQRSVQDDRLAERESGSNRGRDGDESTGAEQSLVSGITYSPDYARWRSRMLEGMEQEDTKGRNAVGGSDEVYLDGVQTDSGTRYAIDSDDVKLREDFIKEFDAKFGEGAAEKMYKTAESMRRAAKRAEVRTKSVEESAAVERTLAKKAKEDALTAWNIYHKKTLREKQRKYQEEKSKLYKTKAEAVTDAIQTERAKADIRVQATEMNKGKHAAERERQLQERMMSEKAKAAERLRIEKDAYQADKQNRSKLQRNAAKSLIRDQKAVEKRRAQVEAEQGMVDTLRKNPRERTKTEKLQEQASALRTLGRSFYHNFVNQANVIDRFAKRQRGGVYASSLVNLLGGCGSTTERIFKEGLVDRSGNRIGESLKAVLLCTDVNGKKVDEAKQALLQDYMLHQHNIDRMSFVSNALKALDDFGSQHTWLVNLSTDELAKLVAATDAEVADSNRIKGKKGWTEADREVARQYHALLENYLAAEDKPVFGDSNGNPVTAETSREIVAKYEADHPWLVDKANGVYAWWDDFMRTWAVGDSLSREEYERMRQTYPHYVPTYRVEKGGVGGAVHVGGTSASVSKATQKAKGSMLEIAKIEDSFANIASKVIRLARNNELFMNIIDTAMMDEEGIFSDLAVFDWDWQDGAYENVLRTQAILNGETQSEIEEAAKPGLNLDNGTYRLTGWKDGRKYSAILSKDLFQSISDITGHSVNDFERTVLKVGNALTGPMKTAITGINPFFAVRNLTRDIPTAIINSTGGKFPKYWAQALAEMKSNSDNWQVFQSLGGTHSGYYNNEKGFSSAMTSRPGPIKTAKGALEWFGNGAEAATRFAEYLSTIDRMGDTYEARVQGIKNSAEVTVDFSRKGRYGKFINVYVPYWNPAVQGIDKMVRSVIDSPDGSAIWKQAVKTGSRAVMCTVLCEAVLQAVLHALDRDDEWEELTDRDKAQYYCIPLPDHKFLKIAKNREWGAILGTPFMLMLEGLDGRPDPFRNYVETSLEPNFLPGAIFRPNLKDGSFDTDIIFLGTKSDLDKNKDFAGQTIIPYALQQGGKTEQYDSETSRLSVALGKLINFSPMQIDYIIKDYFGDFGELFIGLTAPGTYDATPEQVVKNAWDTFAGSFFTDNRYSNQTVSDYYETLDELGKVVNDKKNQMGSEAYKETKEYKTQKALQEMYGNQISDMNKEVRGLPDGEEKDAAKEQIKSLAGQALEFYKECMSGEVQEPHLVAEYANLPSVVGNELIRLKGFNADYDFEPTNYKLSKYTDPDDKKREYVLDDGDKDQYRSTYNRVYGEVMQETMSTSKYQKASDLDKVEMLEEARDSVTELTKEEFLGWLASTRRSTEKSK